MTRVFEHLDEVLARITRQRDELLSDPAADDRTARLIAVFESEARLWSQFYELSSHRLVWRAAVAAEAGARLNGRIWACRVTVEPAHSASAHADVWPRRAGEARPSDLRSPVLVTPSEGCDR